MSTRATYKINDHTFYIHHDGYMEGGANYFLKAAILAGGNYKLAENFLRANEQAEFAPSHEAHGDTEFRYDYNTTKNILNVQASNWETEKWEGVFNGTMEDFINSKAEHWAGHYAPEKVYAHLKTERQILKDLLRGADYIKRWGKEGKFLGNLSSSYDKFRDGLVELEWATKNPIYNTLAQLMIIGAREIRKNFHETDTDIKAVNALAAWTASEHIIRMIESKLSLLEKVRELKYKESLGELNKLTA